MPTAASSRRASPRRSRRRRPSPSLPPRSTRSSTSAARRRKHETSAGTPILQPTDERRRTGSHYTPRSLTAPIVRICAGAGVRAARAGRDAGADPRSEGLRSGAWAPAPSWSRPAARSRRGWSQAWARSQDKKPVIPPDEDEELHARRLVAQRCLYGVDKNPLATDLAKLSLWLATLARDHEFTFLDHALKSGDSLVGLTQAQIAAAHWDTSKPGLPLFRQLVKDRVAEAMKGRAEIQAAPDDTARAIQEQRHRSLEARLKDIRLIGDAVIAAFFAEDKPKAREKKRAEVESWLGGSPVAWDKLAAMAATLKQGAHPLTPFHWEIEFPEVFARENGGFDAIVGNPPFLGGTIDYRNRLGDTYFAWLKEAFQTQESRRPWSPISSDRRLLLLSAMVRRADCDKYNSARRYARGGVALHPKKSRDYLQSGNKVSVARRRCGYRVNDPLFKSKVNLSKLNGRCVNTINSFLVASSIDENPNRLAANRGQVFKGVDIYSMGFTFDDESSRGVASSLERMRKIIAECPPVPSEFSRTLEGKKSIQTLNSALIGLQSIFLNWRRMRLEGNFLY